MILAIDIGGTSVKLGLVDEAGVIHAQRNSSWTENRHDAGCITDKALKTRCFCARGRYSAIKLT